MSVKKKTRGRPKGCRLTPPAIVDCAKKLMRAQGKMPSIRNISGALNVDAMAIYHYFPNKNALLEAITISLINEIYTPTGKKPWQVEIHTLCRSYVKLLRDHPGLLETLLTMTSKGPSAVFIQRFHIALSPLELDSKTVKHALDLIADYLHGFALAMNCTPDDSRLHLGLLDGPLDFYIKALGREAPQ